MVGLDPEPRRTRDERARRKVRALDAALRSGGYSAGKAWSGQVAVPMADGAKAHRRRYGRVRRARGHYTETWTVAAVDEDGKFSGTIELGTVTSRRSQ